MNKILMLAMLCVATANCVELENICSSDCFEYKSVLVNAFHRVRWNVTFEPLSHYLINDSVKCFYSQFENKTNYWETLKIKHAYNRKFAELYTEDLNGNTLEEIKKKSLDLFIAGSGSLYRIRNTEAAKCVKSFDQAIDSGQRLFYIFENMLEYNDPPTGDKADFKPTESDAIKTLENLMNKLKTSGDGQKFAFETDTARSVYLYRGTGLFREFSFLKEGSAGVGPETKSMLTYDLLLPFNNHNHDDHSCVAVQDLPSFYKKKGKDFL